MRRQGQGLVDDGDGGERHLQQPHDRCGDREHHARDARDGGGNEAGELQHVAEPLLGMDEERRILIAGAGPARHLARRPAETGNAPAPLIREAAFVDPPGGQ